jgi:outer membrane receptor protein involved in Fe transport
MRYSIKSGLPIAFATLGSSITGSLAHAQEDATPSLEEVVVTAQRREEKLSDVPLSISAFSQERLDAQGVRSIDDVVRLTPGVTFARADARNGQAATISIRGIASGAGASTTGIYIDDTPIQIRSLGYSSFNTFPQIFDLERVEVLRGPQGTLFGAGSEGGTVRFITPQPSLSDTSSYVRAELANTAGGDPTYEGGAAFGMPLADGKLGFRASAWYRRDGGWVDRINWDRTTRTPLSDVASNSNSQNSTVGKVALTYAPTDTLRITPSIYYQKLKADDSPSYWTALSDPDGGHFNNGNSVRQESEDRFYLPALKIDWTLGPVTLVSNTAYFNRNNEALNDYSAFEAGLWTGNPYFPAGFFAVTSQVNQQSNLTQELRLQSNNPDSRLNWVGGVFFSHSRQTAKQRVQDTFLPGLYNAITGCNFTDPPPPLIPPRPNTCPTQVPAAGFGQPLADGLYTFVADPIIARDEQTALYGQADFKATDRLTLTLGLRASKTKVEAAARYRGPVVGPPVSDSGSQDEKPVTPKAGVSYKINDNNMVYASAAKGFRIGGYNPRVGLPCGGQLASLGLFDASGAPAAPKLFDSDTVWSYELGSKNALADGKFQLNTSVYYIDWKNIQQGVALQCGFTFVANQGSATSKGFDVDTIIDVTSALKVGLSIGYSDAKYDENVFGGPAATAPLVSAGDHIVGSPWSGAAYTQLSFNAFGGRAAYARLDYQYQSDQTDRIASSNPGNGTYNPNAVFLLRQTNLLSARLGMRWSGLDVSAFVNNLADSHPTLSQALSGGIGPVPTLYQQTTFRPRTFGVTATYRY